MNFNTDILIKNWKSIALTLSGLLAVGLIWSIFHVIGEANEKKAQESYAVLDRKFQDYKENQAKIEANLANQKNNPKKEETKLDLKPVEVESLKLELQSFIEKNKSNTAGQMAALSLSDILTEQKKQSESIQWLEKLQSGKSTLLNALVLQKLSATYVDLDQCDKAIAILDKVISDKSLGFAHGEAKINQALCYKKLSNLQKTEEILNTVKNGHELYGESVVAEANRILKLIQFNKNNKI